MTPPTLTAGIGGLLTFASRREPPTFTTITSARSGRWRFPINRTRALRDPERRQGKPGDLSQPSSTAVGGGNPSGERILPGSFAAPSCRVLRQGGFFPSVAIRFGWTHHATSQPSPPVLVACIAPQRAFQGQLFHPRLASTWRYGPTVHRLPGRGDGSTDVSRSSMSSSRFVAHSSLSHQQALANREGRPASANHCCELPHTLGE
jgi:hypothetical protein